MKVLFAASVIAFCLCNQGHAEEITGPARFCGYAPIIDLLPGERITTLGGGIHGGSFRWDGEFGSLMVTGIGWAAPPKRKIAKRGSATRPTLFRQRRVSDGYEIAIWNGAHGAAYFRSPRPFSLMQKDAIERVSLYEEGQTPEGCKLRTVFSWE